jgi:glycosyltransferase involved in cell wall biosynthesis
MLITIIGTHGIPANYGGFETFAQHLAIACANNDIKVRVVNEKNNPVASFHENIEIVACEFNKSEEPLKFYQDSMAIAVADSDIILVCGVGGAKYYSEANKYGIKIITCVDGLEHLRKRYSLIQRIAVYFLQGLAAKKSDRIITDSHIGEKYWLKRFPNQKRKIKMISYGTDDCLPFDPSVLKKFDLNKNEYFLTIARLVPENNIHEIIGAVKDFIGNKKLVLVGRLEDTDYVKDLQEMAEDKVLFLDAIYDKHILDSLRQGCYTYLHGHSVGGTNPSLLEALKAGCACICHDNEFNREVTAGNQLYFDTWDDLSMILNLLEHKNADIDDLKTKASKAVQNYTWDKIYNAYFELFNRLTKSKSNSAE